MEYNFEWDPAKAVANLRKHGVTFEQAAAVFKDPMAMSQLDDEDSDPGEDRWVTLGVVAGQHYLVVAHTYKAQDQKSVTIRVISARRATRHEIRQYEQG
ncbi:hypothetical protein DES49_1355 [Halospina denitrificans]|uniref:Uncharacterized protein n=1 Tax=Halospina denitrificans TaxID=332522 RepID=A0A4R7JZI0_9GAMM|nr:BrnT family toxin [Halospina denitrificans]TDT43536.1 hypothetical protein DES49_1355 [Halospina denitrificans]